MISRKRAEELVRDKVGNENLVKHMYACEACMRNLAEHFGEDTEVWGLAGLLHDIDYDQTQDEFDKHGLISAEILKDEDIPEAVIDSIKAHASKKECTTRMEKAIYAADPLTGLIVAAALMHPEKDITQMDSEFVLRRFDEKRFAAGADRDQIKECEKLDLSLDEFVDITLRGMQKAADQLGL